MTRTRGWSQRGTRLVAKVPHGHWKTLTFIGGLRHDGVVAPCVFDGPINGAMFTAWVETEPRPHPQAARHRRGRQPVQPQDPTAREAIRRAGAHLLFLPPYSPDLNPIEMVFAKLKTLFRKAETRSVEASWRKVGTLLDAFDPKEYAGYFRHAGYNSKNADRL